MRHVAIGIVGLVCVGMAGLALANPALLPMHPGYPSRGEFSYDRGERTLTAAESLQDAAESENANIVQKLEDPSNPTQLRQEGAGSLPMDQGPSTKRVPPAPQATGSPK